VQEDHHKHDRARKKLESVFLTLVSFFASVYADWVLGWTFDGSFIVGGSDEGNGLVVTHAETGEKVHTFNTAGACPLVAWSPTRYWLAYNDMGSLKIVGVDVDKMDKR
jgi:hypothetical protein